MLKKEEKYLYLFILLNPLFDILSSFFAQLGFRITPSTLLRPLMPFGLIVYIFIKDKTIRKKTAFLMCIYVIYSVIHLLIYKNMITEFSYGSLLHETQYLANYTYLVFTFLTFLYIFYKKKDEILKRAIFITSSFYIFTIYLSYFTNTSLTSYLEGVGFKGWFNTSGAVGTILIISLFIVIPYLKDLKIKVIYKFIYIFIIMFYLYFLIGSRVGMIGSLLIFGTTFFSIIFSLIIKKDKIIPYEIISPMILVILLSFFINSNTFVRRHQLNDMTVPDEHIASDLKTEIEKYDNDEMLVNNNILLEQKTALKLLKKYAEKNGIKNCDLRKQQLIYHSYLYKIQSNVLLKLFGNGYLINRGVLTLEMEAIALLFNFGIIGFILFYLIFIIILLLNLYFGLKNLKKLDVEYFMLVAGSVTSFGISTLAGHSFFNTSVIIVVVVLNILLVNKMERIKNEKNSFWNN